MKKLINKISTLILTVVLLFASISMASVKAFEVEESLRLAVISDLHYYPVSYTGNNNVEYQKFAKGHMRLVGENSA
ncbi:hypothetical protein, partial [Campylobacter jejuni]|uniref:hypothetical protein n=1 Tax=Campylobacter jejuni TaxID=197 RepID=UPI001BD94711